MSNLEKENALLKRQLKDPHLQQSKSNKRLAAAEWAMAGLSHQLERAPRDLDHSEHKAAILNLKMDMAKKKIQM